MHDANGSHKRNGARQLIAPRDAQYDELPNGKSSELLSQYMFIETQWVALGFKR